ncbi:MAG: SM-20-related protein [Candidatus Azotimanducaceae bacterium]|jgi:SM-20-related protein
MLLQPSHVLPESVLSAVIATALSDPGYLSLDVCQQTLIGADLLDQLSQAADWLGERDYRVAKIGREDREHKNHFVRTDKINWVYGSTPATAEYLSIMDALRAELNKQLFLGLFEYECQFVRYESGDFYKRHKDAFSGERNRIVSTIVYLNRHWQPGDGGELVIYCPESLKEVARVEPRFGTLVVFLSEEFPHEVLPSQQKRLSLTGWFRVNREGML